MSIHRSTVSDRPGDVASRIGVRVGLLGALAIGAVALGSPQASAGDLVDPETPIVTDPVTDPTPDPDPTTDPTTDPIVDVDVCADLAGVQVDVGDCPADPDPTTDPTPDPTTDPTPTTNPSPVGDDDDAVDVTPGEDANGSTPRTGSNSGSTTVNLGGVDASDSTVDSDDDTSITPVGAADTGDGSSLIAPAASTTGTGGEDEAVLAALGVAAMGALGVARWRSRGRHRAAR